MKKFGFPKEVRLLKPAEFDRVFHQKCSNADALLVIYMAPNPVSDSTRIGLVVSRKCGNAVQRNRWKRLLREAFRLEQHRLPPACDFVLIPKAREKTGEIPSLEMMRRSLPELVKRVAQKMENRRAAGEPGR